MTQRIVIRYSLTFSGLALGYPTYIIQGSREIARTKCGSVLSHPSGIERIKLIHRVRTCGFIPRSSLLAGWTVYDDRSFEAKISVDKKRCFIAFFAAPMTTSTESYPNTIPALYTSATPGRGTLLSDDKYATMVNQLSFQWWTGAAYTPYLLQIVSALVWRQHERRAVGAADE